jgi:hypothetical protein
MLLYGQNYTRFDRSGLDHGIVQRHSKWHTHYANGVPSFRELIGRANCVRQHATD